MGSTMKKKKKKKSDQRRITTGTDFVKSVSQKR